MEKLARYTTRARSLRRTANRMDTTAKGDPRIVADIVQPIIDHLRLGADSLEYLAAQARDDERGHPLGSFGAYCPWVTEAQTEAQTAGVATLGCVVR